MDQFWLPLILGLIAGWLIEWLVDWAYWRPQVDALRQQNADLRRQLAETAAELPGHSGQVSGTDADDNSVSSSADVPLATSAVPLTGDRRDPPSEDR